MPQLLLQFLTIFAITKSEDEICPSENVEYYSNELPIVTLNYNDLNNKINLTKSIEIAYGTNGSGVLFVKDIPNLNGKRTNLLKISRKISRLDENIKKLLEDKESFFNIGYSHGNEMLAVNTPDLRKMSYFANPIINDPSNGNEELIQKYRSAYGANIWPDDDIPELEQAFMELGSLVYDVGGLIAHQLDQYVMNKRNGYKSGLFKEIITNNVPKARLLYYFSDNEMNEMYNIDTDKYNNNRLDNWCGWHNDHGALTGLILGMYFDKNGNIITDINNYNNNNDELHGGLHVKTRKNKTYNIALNEEESSKYLAFQIGETSQIFSSGAVVATPHSVMSYKSDNYYDVSRSSFAVFLQPTPNKNMISPYHPGLNIEDVQFDRFVPDNVPPLATRWFNESNDTFGKFQKRTFQAFY